MLKYFEYENTQASRIKLVLMALDFHRHTASVGQYEFVNPHVYRVYIKIANYHMRDFLGQCFNQFPWPRLTQRVHFLIHRKIIHRLPDIVRPRGRRNVDFHFDGHTECLRFRPFFIRHANATLDFHFTDDNSVTHHNMLSS